MNKIEIENLSSNIRRRLESLRGISMGIRQNAVTVLFGPAGGGKSTPLRCLNRLNDLTDIRTSSGRILIDGKISSTLKRMWIALRRKVGHGLCTTCHVAHEHPREHHLRVGTRR